jgi:ribose transport system ATP-binding protein
VSVVERMPARLEARRISKAFGGVQALDDFSLTILPGEVHGLLGENGSGKSTFIKVLAGYHAPDGGELVVDGGTVKLPVPPGAFRDLGMGFVHQELGLVSSLSAVENYWLSKSPRRANRYYVSWRRERAQMVNALARYDVKIDPRAPVAQLQPVERASLAIVRAFEFMREERQEDGGSGLLILDEPTVFLPRRDKERLFRLIRDLTQSDGSVLFVSHDLDDARAITDRVTVVRNGKNVGTVDTLDVTDHTLIEMIIGRRLAAFAATAQPARQDDQLIRISNVSGEFAEDVSLVLRRNEVVGLAGLPGSGFEDIPYILFGAKKAEGSLELGTELHDLSDMTPEKAIELGMALVPSDRQINGCIGSLSVRDNVMMQTLPNYFRYGRLHRRQIHDDCRQLGQKFDVRPNDPGKIFELLSGGNQQKALLAKWLQERPGLLLLDEPTQGVDIGARQEIFRMIRETATGGTGVLCASSDHEQLATISDRVLIFAQGRVSQELQGEDITKERISEQCYRTPLPSRAGAAEAVRSPRRWYAQTK